MVLVGQIAVGVFAVVVGVVLHLKQTVHFHHPGHLGTHIGAQDGCGQLGVVFRGDFVAQVVHQSGHNGFQVCAIGLGAGGALKRMLQAAQLVALE